MASDDTAPGRDFKEYTSFGADINLVSESALAAACRMIRVITAGTGTLVVVTVGGVSRTFTALTDGEELPIQARQITASGTNITKIRVYW